MSDSPDLAAELDKLRRWNAAVYARRETCDQVAEWRWSAERFPARCALYPGRDCPGWRPGQVCARIGTRIPDE